MDVKANMEHSWTEYFRVITPFLLVVLNGFGFLLYGKISDMDNKLFKHLTNDEIHCPRSQMTSKTEFDLLRQMRDKEIEDLKCMVKEEFIQLKNEIRNSVVYKR